LATALSRFRENLQKAKRKSIVMPGDNPLPGSGEDRPRNVPDITNPDAEGRRETAPVVRPSARWRIPPYRCGRRVALGKSWTGIDDGSARRAVARRPPAALGAKR